MRHQLAGSVFISYGRADMTPFSWIERLRLYLAQNRREDGLDIWDDSKISTGEEWRRSIRTAIDRADAAIVLVGPAFLASEFVMTEELPHLLAAVHSRGVRIFPLIVSYSAFKRSALEPFNAFNNPDEPLESLPPPEQNRIINKLAIDVDAALRNPPQGSPAPRGASGDKITALKSIQRELAGTRTAFEAQARLRNALVEMLKRRLGSLPHLEYERLFFHYYHEFTRDERFEFHQIRAITDGPLHQGNRSTLKVLESHPELLDDVPVLVNVRQHLVFWLNKYDRVFRIHPEMCLLYVGVEDAVPFPSDADGEIDRQVQHLLKEGRPGD
jgi:hypothetical protein